MPLMPYREWQRMAVQLRHLAQLRRRVVALEHALDDARKLDPRKASATGEGSR